MYYNFKNYITSSVFYYLNIHLEDFTISICIEATCIFTAKNDRKSVENAGHF